MSKSSQRVRADYQKGFQDGRMGYFNRYKGNKWMWSYHHGYREGYYEYRKIRKKNKSIISRIKTLFDKLF